MKAAGPGGPARPARRAQSHGCDSLRSECDSRVSFGLPTLPGPARPGAPRLSPTRNIRPRRPPRAESAGDSSDAGEPMPPCQSEPKPGRPGPAGPGQPQAAEARDTWLGIIRQASAGESEARRLGLSNLKPLPGHSGSSEAQRLPMPVADDPSRTLSPYCCRHRHRGPRPPTRFMVRPA